MPSSRPFVQLSNTKVSCGKIGNSTPFHDLIGQKCSALSRLYVSSSVWNAEGFMDKLLEQVAEIKVGSPTRFDNFMGPVM
jgi:delta 1-pyrroline-5-carboxylate dehydrogenase